MRGRLYNTLIVVFMVWFLFPCGLVISEGLPEQEPDCGEGVSAGFGGCIGYKGLSIDGGGETLLPYGTLESHPTLEIHYHEPAGAGLLDLSLTYDGLNHYDLWGDYYGVTSTAVIRSHQYPRNLEHLNLPGPFNTASSPQYWSQDLDPDAEYHLDQQEHYASFKYKWRTYPANVSVAVRQHNTEGERQQLFLNENCTTNCHLISETRKVKTSTDQVTVKGSTHLGLVDVSYRFTNTQFADDMADPIYSFGSIPSYTGTRDVHNTYPDMNASEHLLSVSTNHTGRYSGFFGLGLGERENRDLDLVEAYQGLLGQFLWRPNARISLILDTRQFYRQDDSPGNALEASRLSDGSPLRYGSLDKRHRLTVNYYPADVLDMKGEISLTGTKREDNELWGLPNETTSNGFSLTARLKPAAKVKVKAEYTGRTTDNPAYRSAPTDSRKIAFSGRWVPSARLCLDADLKDFSDENTDSNQKNDRQILAAGVTYTPERPFALALRVYQFTNDISADLTFADIAPIPVTDENVPYSAEGTQFMLHVLWSVSKKLQIAGQYSYLQAEGSFDADTTAFSDVEDYSGLDAVQQESSLDLQYTMKDGWGLSARFAQLSYEDKEGRQEDEDVSQVSASVTRRW